MNPKVELPWFDGCANHPAARRILEGVIAEVVPGLGTCASYARAEAVDPICTAILPRTWRVAWSAMAS